MIDERIALIGVKRGAHRQKIIGTALLMLTILLSQFFAWRSPAAANTPDNRAYLGGYMPYSAFERLPKTIRNVRGGILEIAFAPGRLALGRDKILKWIERSARAVEIYYKRFPVKKARLLIVPVAGRGVKGGQAWGHGGSAIRVTLGSDSTEADLGKDWVMVHEMVHLAWPQMHARHVWLTEGLSTYVESIARHQAGDLTAEFIWRGFAKAMHQGLPARGDRGLDFTHTWGRTYWGGALYCLLADIRIRQRTGNRFGLQDALRGIVKAGGTNETGANIAYALRTGDEVTGVDVLIKLYHEMRAAPVKPDLNKLWRDLGVVFKRGAVRFNESAPLAHIRRKINRPGG